MIEIYLLIIVPLSVAMGFVVILQRLNGEKVRNLANLLAEAERKRFYLERDQAVLIERLKIAEGDAYQPLVPRPPPLRVISEDGFVSRCFDRPNYNPPPSQPRPPVPPAPPRPPRRK